MLMAIKKKGRQDAQLAVDELRHQVRAHQEQAAFTSTLHAAAEVCVIILVMDGTLRLQHSMAAASTHSDCDNRLGLLCYQSVSHSARPSVSQSFRQSVS
jgi:bisphosphoglycerate-dependent phosphoglycerate mutase